MIRTVKAEMIKHWMSGSITAGEAVIGEASDLQIASLEDDNRPRQKIEVNANC